MTLTRRVTGCQNAAAFDHVCFAPCTITQMTRVSASVIIVAMDHDKLTQCIAEYNTMARLDALPSLENCRVGAKQRLQRSTTFVVQSESIITKQSSIIKSIITKQNFSYVRLIEKRSMKTVQNMFADASRVASVHHDKAFYFERKAFIHKA